MGTTMISSCGVLSGLVAALNWQRLTLLLDTLLHWPNISNGAESRWRWSPVPRET